MGFKVASRVRGLSDEAFREAFGTKEQCRAALVRLRWPDGFVCPCCGHREHCVLAGRGLYQCNRCKKQTSPTAGTIFHATKLPLTLWFAAIHLVVTAKNGISSVELGRRLGVKQPTAWAVKHKIMAVMARREGETRLTGRVEMDDAYLGGVRSGGKRGRGAAGKTPFVAAVSTSPEGRPRKLKLAPVKGFRKREIARGAKHWLAPGAAVVTDGLGCWSALDEAACSHQAIRTGSGRQAARMASFKWVNTTLGNIKSAITGTYRKLGPDHAGRYLASFAWRYNRRYQLQTMIPRFVHSAARTQPLPYRLQERFAQEGYDGLLRDKTRPSRIPPLGPEVAERVVALTLSDPPAEATHWVAAMMAKATGISVSSVQRIWRAHGLRPHRVRQFKLSNDPDFVAKLRDVVGLYVDPPAHAIVLSVDEKSQIQALDRTQPGLPMKKGRLGTMTHDYKRHGTTTLFAALNVLEGKVIGRCMQRHRHQEFIRFLNAIEADIPAGKGVHVILDNYAAHKHAKVRAWLGRHERFTFHFVPTSCSWLNAVEGFFAKLSKRRLKRGVFRSIVDLQVAINRFLDETNDNPKPFTWTADPDKIIAAVKRGHQVLDSIH